MTYTFDFAIDPTVTSNYIEVEVWVDATCIFGGPVTESIGIAHTVPEDEGEHELRIVMSGKQASDTKLDEDEKIISDVLLHLKKMTIAGQPAEKLFNEQATYTHDFNGTAPEATHKFFGIMGCNGTVSLKFTTPIYLWVLANS
jgi:hypothetical protein